MAGEITKRDRPAKQTFIDQHVAAPFAELSQLGQQLAKEKSIKRAALSSISDDLLGIKATPEDRATRDRIIETFKKRIGDIAQSPERNQDAEISQLSDSIAHEVSFGNLSRISENFSVDVSNRKQETSLRTKDGGKLFDEQFSLSPVRKVFEETYGKRKDFIPDSSNLDEEGNVKLRQNVLPRAHHDVNAFFTPIFAKIKPDLIQTAQEDRAKGLITTTKEGGITDKRIYGEAFNLVISGLVPPFMEDQVREEVGSLSTEEVEAMAKRSIANVPFEPGEEPVEFEDLSPDEILDYAMIDRIAKIGHNQVHRIAVQTKKGFGRGDLIFNGRGGLKAKKFRFDAREGKGEKIGIVSPFFEDFTSTNPLALEVGGFWEVLVNKGDRSKNPKIPITDPNNPDKKIDVSPTSIRRPKNSDEIFLFGERVVDKPTDQLTVSEKSKVRRGQRVTITVQENFPWELVKKDFANKFGGHDLISIDFERLISEIQEKPAEEEAPEEEVEEQPAAKEAIKLTGTIIPSELVVDQIYDVGGRIGKWNGTKFVAVK